MKNEEIIDQLDDDIEFIGFAITPLHARNIEMIRRHFGFKKGVVIVAPHNRTGYPNNLHLFEENTNIVRIEIPYEEFENKGNSFLPKTNPQKKRLFFITAFFKDDWALLLQEKFSNCQLTYLIIDSGLGSYENHINEEILKRADGVFTIDARKYTKDYDGILSLNQQFAEAYIKPINQISEKEKMHHGALLRNSVLLCTQPLKEDGIIEDNCDIKLYKKIIDYAKTNNYKVVIKTHPRESKEKYKYLSVEILETDYMLEDLFAQCEKPACIISPFSTVMIDAKLLYNIPAISVLKILDLNSYSYLEQEYKYIFTFPRNESELYKLVFNIKK